MKRSSISIFAVVIITFFISSWAAAQSPLQLSLYNPVQLVHETGSVKGISLGLIYTVNDNVTGLSLTLLANRVTGDMKGIQFGLLNQVEGDVTGYQEGAVNMVDGDFTGWQNGFLNFNEGLTHGLQTGFFSRTGDLRGVQFSFVNMADTLYGIQLGLVNINRSGEPFGFLPIVNWSF